jgi:hypothetical protein
MGGDFFLEWRYTSMTRVAADRLSVMPAMACRVPGRLPAATAVQSSDRGGCKRPGAPEGLENA